MSNGQGRPWRVLVVDDDAVIREVIGEFLRDQDYETVLAAHGREALALMRQWRPDLVILDLMMPVMDGWEVRALQRADADLATIPVLIMTATREINERVAPLAPAAIVPKPFDLPNLLATVQRLLPDAQPATD
jgi:CheY-like chemotaxis protein